MRGERFFCAVESLSRGEAMFGTVAHIRAWLLLEYPKAWRHDAIGDSRLLSSAVKSRIRSMKQSGAIDRALLIRRDREPEGPLRCFFVRSAPGQQQITRFELGAWEDLPDNPDGGDRVDDLLFAVCTHGRHDRCCAKFGIPLSCAFQELAGERAWQCSHVGGDRFAGNVVVFPYGIYYGRARPENVPEIVRRSEAREVWLPGFRGRSCFPRAVQVATYFAHRESGRMAVDEFHPVGRSHPQADVTCIRLRAQSDSSLHTVEFVTRESALRERLTCDAAEESPVPQYDLLRYTLEL